ncbi:MAG: enoyl-CoA hydratase, partial [Burkholderiales bacterium PBB5]
MTTDTDLLLTEIHPAGYAVLTMNRPGAMNALSKALMNALADTVDALGARPEVRVIILTGAGRAFTAGLDLKEIGAGQGSLGGTDGRPLNDPVAAIARFPGPVIGAINGAAVTGGFELALACDVLLASRPARFADTHAR